MLMNISVLYYILLRSLYHIITKPVKNYLYIKISFDFVSVWIVTFSMCLTRHTACHCFEAKAIERMKCFTMFSIPVAVPVYSVSLQNQLHMCVPSCWEPLSSVHHCHQCHWGHAEYGTTGELTPSFLKQNCWWSVEIVLSIFDLTLRGNVLRRVMTNEEYCVRIPSETGDKTVNSGDSRGRAAEQIIIDQVWWLMLWGGEVAGERGKDGGGLTGSR